ncbi:MAG: N-acetylglucosamine-6-phosphate deacetylase [Rhodobacteraceae bacterium]|jgi:N-acetylglucosamine-6-phosphate deacetylase|nr:N-acetylglucosamine-6-phosphate deacetylase [Paracoccaceae bacterium]
MTQAFTGAAVFDGWTVVPDAVLVVEHGHVAAVTDRVPAGATEVRLAGGILAPGLIDLQVNGGGGRMVDGSADAGLIAHVCAAHARLGATGILPTLITDTAEATRAVIAAGIAPAAQGVPGFLGLHLEGPHLDPRRKGAHDAALIRPMGDDDLAMLEGAARALPALMVTLAPAAATPDQIARLAAAGAVVSLGHAECTVAEAQAAFAAGARCATHLFNAMTQLGNREPGLVGAVLAGTVAAGIIADGIHVAPDSLRVALAARPEGLFAVSDAMAVAGTEMDRFTLGGREILRAGGRLTLADGTLAGADLSLPQALAVLTGPTVGLDPAHALAMATRVPADVIGRADLGRLTPGARADLVHLGAGMALRAVWRDGARLA